ncbi:hypothetical protein EJB05_56095, partial [Eragrostis curvula]
METLKRMIESGFGDVCKGTSFCSVAVVKGVASVSAHAIKRGGFGYDWRHIQRVGRHAEKVEYSKKHIESA